MGFNNSRLALATAAVAFISMEIVKNLCRKDEKRDREKGRKKEKNV